MSTQSLDDIAGQLKNNASKVQLIYAFNGTGKTRLSRAFKELFQIQEDDFKTKHKIIYYNAFTEDLFYWDNDLEGNSDYKLKIQPNSFTDWILKDQGQDQNIVTNFQRYIRNKLTPSFNEACTEVVFSLERGNDEHFDNLKISKGEESSFIWNIFYTLLSQIISVLNQKPEDRETPDYNDLEYIFIDDPVSSLDDNHLIQMACDLAVLINGSSSPLKFVIATHSTVFYNVLFEELNIKNKKKDGTSFILRQVDDGFKLEEKQGAANRSFSYHLDLIRIIETAIENKQIGRYHFMLLRNLYEKTSSFLGYEKWRDILPEDKKLYHARIMNFTSHSLIAHDAISEPTDPEKETVRFLLDYLIKNYNFKGTHPLTLPKEHQ